MTAVLESQQEVFAPQYAVLGFRLARNGVVDFETGQHYEIYANEETFTQLGKDAIAAQCYVNFVSGSPLQEEPKLDSLGLRAEFSGGTIDTLGTAVLRTSVDYAIEQTIEAIGAKRKVAKLIARWQKKRGDADALSVGDTRDMLVDIWRVTGSRGSVKKDKAHRHNGKKIKYLTDLGVDTNLHTLATQRLARCVEFTEMSAYMLRKIGVVSGVIAEHEIGEQPHMYAFAMTDTNNTLRIETTSNLRVNQGIRANLEHAHSVTHQHSYEQFGFENHVIDFVRNTEEYSEDMGEEIARQYALLLTSSYITVAQMNEAIKILHSLSAKTPYIGNRLRGILLDAGADEPKHIRRHVFDAYAARKAPEALKYSRLLQNIGPQPDLENTVHLDLLIKNNLFEEAAEYISTLPDEGLIGVWQKDCAVLGNYLTHTRIQGDTVRFTNVMQRLDALLPQDANIHKLWLRQLEDTTDFDAIQKYVSDKIELAEDSEHIERLKTLLVATATITGDQQLVRATLEEQKLSEGLTTPEQYELIGLILANSYLSTIIERQDKEQGKNGVGFELVAIFTKLAVRRLELQKSK